MSWIKITTDFNIANWANHEIKLLVTETHSLYSISLIALKASKLVGYQSILENKLHRIIKIFKVWGQDYVEYSCWLSVSSSLRPNSGARWFQGGYPCCPYKIPGYFRYCMTKSLDGRGLNLVASILIFWISCLLLHMDETSVPSSPWKDNAVSKTVGLKCPCEYGDPLCSMGKVCTWKIFMHYQFIKLNYHLFKMRSGGYFIKFYSHRYFQHMILRPLKFD